MHAFAQSTDTLNAGTQANRLGINTLNLKNEVIGRIFSGKHTVLANVASNQLFNNAQLKGNKFVNNDYLAEAFHTWQLTESVYVGQHWLYNDYRANNTRIAAGYAQVGKVYTHTRHRANGNVDIGYIGDKRGGYQNYGFSYQAHTWHKYLSKDTSLQVYSVALWQDHLIHPRRNNYLRLNANVFKDFDGMASIEFGAAKLRRRMEDYVLSDIQSIISDTALFKLNFRYQFTERLFFRSQNQFFTPDRKFDYRRIENQQPTRNVFYNEQNFESAQELYYQGQLWQNSIRFELRQRNREYGIKNTLDPKAPDYTIKLAQLLSQLEQEKIKDIREQYYTWLYNLSIAPNRKNLVKINYLAQLYRVDTRSPLNNQDRDEILYGAEILWQKRIMTGLKTDLKLSGNYRQFVFIMPEQSIENFKERILRFEPTLRWSRQYINWTANYGVWATYQVRDFESVQDKNRSNRVHIMQHQLDLKLDPKYRLKSDILRRENRLSLLNWKRFSESPIDTVVIYDISLRLQRTFDTHTNNDLNIQAGYRYFTQNRKNLRALNDGSGTQKKAYVSNIILQHGPQVMAFFQKGQRFRFNLDLWLQQSKVFYRYHASEQAYFGSSISIEELQRIERRFLPYFTIQAFYNHY